MKKPLTSLVVLTTTLAFVLASCASSTMIRSNVPGAKVFLNGEFVGNTPYMMSDTKIVGSTTSVRIEAPGYAPTMTSITRSEEFSVGACIGGVFLLVPFLWVMNYKADHYYQLQPGQPGYPQPGYPPAARPGYPPVQPGYPPQPRAVQPQPVPRPAPQTAPLRPAPPVPAPAPY